MTQKASGQPERPIDSRAPRVVVKVFGALRERLGAASREVDVPPGGTIRDLLRVLGSLVPALVPDLERGLSEGYLNVLVDGRNARFLDDLETRLHGGETVAFLPPIGGG
jgi:MoaD family protein